MRTSYFQNLCGRFVGSCGEQTPVRGDGNAAHLENRVERAKNISPIASKITEYARPANTERLSICLWCSCMGAEPLPGRGWRGLLSRLARALAVPSVGGPISRRGCRQRPARSYADSHLVFQRTACSWLPGGRPRRTRASRSCGVPGPQLVSLERDASKSIFGPRTPFLLATGKPDPTPTKFTVGKHTGRPPSDVQRVRCAACA